MIIILVLSFFISLFSGWFVFKYGIKLGFSDLPSKRSLHNAETPRGGGLGIVLSIALIISILSISGELDVRVILAFSGGGVLIAIIGLIDDYKRIATKWRILSHFMVALWAVFLLDGFHTINIGISTIHLGWIGTIFTVIGIVWLINLYNFMDGIDGIAGIEAIFVGGTGGVLLALSGQWSLAYISWGITIASLGFLVWNWQPAKIFMGDGGSGFLGFVFAILILESNKASSVPLISWLILLSVFIFDSTVTLFIRIFKGEKIWEAHRSHFYQRAVLLGYSHQTVSLAIACLNIILATLALMAYHFQQIVMLFFIIQIGILIIVLLWIKKKENKLILLKHTKLKN